MSRFKAKMHEIRFMLGLCPKPHWGSVQCSPRLSMAEFKGAITSKEREGRKDGREGQGRREEQIVQHKM